MEKRSGFGWHTDTTIPRVRSGRSKADFARLTGVWPTAVFAPLFPGFLRFCLLILASRVMNVMRRPASGPDARKECIPTFSIDKDSVASLEAVRGTERTPKHLVPLRN